LVCWTRREAESTQKMRARRTENRKKAEKKNGKKNTLARVEKEEEEELNLKSVMDEHNHNVDNVKRIRLTPGEWQICPRRREVPLVMPCSSKITI
jgi:predicted transposase YdaD